MNKGQIVCSTAGRDKGSFLIVVEEREDSLLVCDGKARPLERPKLKNKKHLILTNDCIAQDRISGNNSLRRALNEYAAARPKEENLCLKKI